ncbi:MAG: hypothetical protein EWM73_03673 [Nitrospira sp.]|nr:MAG: hypothetical protein EWM73_03673 [Nitrospira sp.]
MPVGSERDAGWLVAARPGGKTGDVDEGAEAARRALRHGLEAQRDQLGMVAACGDVVGALVFRSRAADDEGPIGAVRLPLQHVGGEVELGREEIVHAAVGRQLERIVHLPAPPEEEGVHDGVVLDRAAVVVIEHVEPAFPAPDRAVAADLDGHEPPLPDHAPRLCVQGDAVPLAVHADAIAAGRVVDLLHDRALEGEGDQVEQDADI